VKTNRYILHLLKLLTETVAPYFSFPVPLPSHITVESRSHIYPIHAAMPELTFLARLFHVLLVWQTGKTLGMERLGIIFRASSKTEPNSPFTSQLQSATNADFISCEREVEISRIIFPWMISSSSPSYLRAWSFLLLYTFSPHLVHRTGRGGMARFHLSLPRIKKKN